MSNYDEVCLLCCKIEFAVFKIKDLTEKHCDFISEEEIDKAKQLCNEQELRAQEALTFCRSYLKNMVKASQVKSEVDVIENFLNLINFDLMNIENY